MLRRNSPRTPTLTEVARIAGVSEITVSRVVRGKGPISEKTRARVREAIALLGYRPNRAAGMLASSTSLLIGVVLPSMSNVVFPEVLRGIYAGLAGSPGSCVPRLVATIREMPTASRRRQRCGT